MGDKVHARQSVRNTCYTDGVRRDTWQGQTDDKNWRKEMKKKAQAVECEKARSVEIYQNESSYQAS